MLSQEMGEAWAEEHPSPAGYQMGFHSVPSMDHLHLHVISRVSSSPAASFAVLRAVHV